MKIYLELNAPMGKLRLWNNLRILIRIRKIYYDDLKVYILRDLLLT